jgi:hypothetical protein
LPRHRLDWRGAVDWQACLSADPQQHLCVRKPLFQFEVQQMVGWI